MVGGILTADPENTDGFVLRKAARSFDVVTPDELAAIHRRRAV
jgi:hypothetical protein